MLPPTDPRLTEAETRPYFLWWTEATVADLRRHLRDADLDTRAYWMGALLREANSRDVWLFVTPEDIRSLWPRVVRHLGRRRDEWGYLLDLDATWPPTLASPAAHA
ncbi:MAG: hypothetical protein AAGN82_25525 [Myxococcota bacterium]